MWSIVIRITIGWPDTVIDIGIVVVFVVRIAFALHPLLF
jgi:hypothetical protein